MKKAKLLKKLKSLYAKRSHTSEDVFDIKLFAIIEELSRDVKKKQQKEIEYLTPVEAINMLVSGCANRITHTIDYYYEIDKNNIICCYNNSDDSFITNCLCIDLDDKWWVLK